ncbi:glycosyltransferase [Cupriavidus basilensis]|uniref:glycosyltransferase n=1 Tax=Cupriavidus basilensis TaxID=68895 RepID=UPI0009E57959|nr:glycosyltransferase [Cupriavidus basilensis]
MKIAVVYHYFPHYRKGVFEELSARYKDVTFISSDWDSLEGIPRLSVENLGTAVEFPSLRLGRMIYQRGLCSYVFKERFDVVIFLANPNFASTWLAACIARLRGSRVIFWGHGFLHGQVNIKNRIRKIYFKLANASYVYGYGAKKNAVALGFDPTHVHVGFNSLDYGAQLVIRERLLGAQVNLCGDVFHILCVSRLTELCKYDLLIRAIALFSDEEREKIRLEFVGAGPAELKLKDLAADLGIHATFRGAIYDEEVVAGRIFSADVVVSPGKVGLTAIHSMTYGTPVITLGKPDEQMPEYEAVIDGVTGILYESQSAAGINSALVRFRSIFLNRKLTRECCFRVVDEIYNPRSQVDVIERAFHGLPAKEGNDVSALVW